MAIKTLKQTNSVTKRTVALTPYEVYLRRVQSCTDALRASSAGLEYVPMQLGGLSGQRSVVTSTTVADVIDFKIQDI